MTQTFLNLIKTVKPQTKKKKEERKSKKLIPITRNMKKTTPKDIIINLFKPSKKFKKMGI